MWSLAMVMSTAADDISTDRPSTGASASTVGSGVFQIETGLQTDIAAQNRLSLPTLLRAGVGEHLELRLDSSVLSLAPSSTQWGGLAPAAKYTLHSTETVALGFLAGAGLSLGDADLSPYAALLADILSLWVNAGWGGGSTVYYATGCAIPITADHWSPFVETAGSVDLSAVDWDGSMQAGLVWASGNIEADVYLQTSLNGFDAHMVATGLAVRLGAD